VRERRRARMIQVWYRHAADYPRQWLRSGKHRMSATQ
jgi:hypothetical protein